MTAASRSNHGNRGPRPNFLFIVADDLNSWIGALGRHPDVRTPHIDALAQRGALFTNAYCSAPYCNASRMGVFTGCLPSTTGIYQSEPFWDAPRRRPTVVELLRASGYYTFGAGKVFHGSFDYATAGHQRTDANWREMENRSFLWDEYYRNPSEPLPRNRPLNKLFDFDNFDTVPPPYRHFDWGPLPDDRVEDTPDAHVARAVTKFLRNAPARPFFCAAGFYKPHLPWHAPKQFFDLYDVNKITLPVVKDDDLDDVPPIARQWALTPPDHELITSRHQWPQAVQGYLACITYVDSLIGKLVEALDQTGLSETTAIVLWGDNGFHLGEKLHWRKFALWDEATRVPLIIVPPGACPPRRISEPVSLIDLFPTLAEMAKLTRTPRTDACSLVPFISDESVRRPAPVVMTWGKGNHSVRRDQWRYIQYSDGTEELYDHASDPHEWTNLAAEKTHRKTRRTLKAAIPWSKHFWKRRLGSLIPF